MQNSNVSQDESMGIQASSLPKCSNQTYQQQQSFEQGPKQISEIEKFLQKNYREVTDLQSYLIKELQNIQNCKIRNKKVQNIINFTILPTLEETKHAVNSLKSIFKLVNSLSVNYLEAVAEKSRNLLNEKEQKCQRYQLQIINLKKEIQELKEKTKPLKFNNVDIENTTKMQVPKHKYFEIKKVDNQLNETYEQKEKPVLSSNKKRQKYLNNTGNCFRAQYEVPCLKDSRSNQQQASKNKSPNKLNKYEECYQNILKTKKVNISYKCDKTPTKETKESLSPSKVLYQLSSTMKVGRMQSDPLAEDRKQYIKQKIEKIKLRAECKQYQRNVTPKQRFR